MADTKHKQEVMSMIERVARAMAEINDHHQEFEIGDFRDAYLDMARAAIEAMREPTSGIMAAVADACPGYTMPETRKRIWLRGIDAALNEQVAG